MNGKTEAQRQPWQVDVDVYLYDSGATPPFKIESYLQADKKNDNLQFHNRGRHGFLINFHLHDETGKNYQFPKPADKAEALWSSMGPGCPPPNCGQWKEFTAERIIQNRSVLVVRNLNETVTEFGYTLRVTNDDGATYRDLDPGGDNWNGSFR